jgi:hypothetical protein
MGTTMYACGCFITSSMFGEREIIQASACLKHSSLVTKELTALADKIMNLQKINQDGVIA